jgi:hypothetical protein
LLRHTTPDAKSRARRQQTTTSGARIPRLGAVAHREFRTRDAARHALDGFYGSSNRLVVRLRPAKVGWEPMKEFLKLPVLSGLIVLCVWRIRILWAHVHLTHAIVGETVNLAESESHAGFGIGRNPVAQGWAIAPAANSAEDQLVLVRSAAVEDESTVHMPIGTHNEADLYVKIVILGLQHRVWSEQGFRWASLSTARPSVRLGNNRELGDMHGDAAQVLFQVGK